MPKPAESYNVDEARATALATWNMTNHPIDEVQTSHVVEIRVQAIELARIIIERCPISRERSQSLTELESTLMWAVASIARGSPME